jgi:hypothetical protein
MLIRAVTSHPKTYRFASTGPYYIEIGDQPRVSRQAAPVLCRLGSQRARQIDIADPQQREAVIQYHRAARDFWSGSVDRTDAAGRGGSRSRSKNVT